MKTEKCVKVRFAKFHEHKTCVYVQAAKLDTTCMSSCSVIRFIEY